MAYTEIYFKSWCPYSIRALALLTSKGAEFKAINLTNDADKLEHQMRERSGRPSVPQIFRTRAYTSVATTTGAPYQQR